MGKLLWKPSEERITGSNMYRFMTFVNGRHQQNFTDYDGLYAWSVSQYRRFLGGRLGLRRDQGIAKIRRSDRR